MPIEHADQGGGDDPMGVPSGFAPHGGAPDEPPTAAAHERTFLVVVDGSAEWRCALRFACRRAQRTGGHVALLHTIEPVTFQHWLAVAEKMRAEVRAEAEAHLSAVSEEVFALTGRYPIIHIREGTPAEQLIKLIEEEPTVSILVLAARRGGDGPGPLVSYLTGKGIAHLRVPVAIVPGTLSDADIDLLS